MKIQAIYDNGGKTIDRYTIVTNQELTDCSISKGQLAMLGLSNDPTHPQGFSQWSGGIEGKHLGKKIHFEDLPEALQEHVASRVFVES